MSLAYFLAFGIFVPLASYLIVYFLYLLRAYLFEHVVVEAAARGMYRSRSSGQRARVRSMSLSPTRVHEQPATTNAKPAVTTVFSSHKQSSMVAETVRLRQNTFHGLKDKRARVLPTKELPTVESTENFVDRQHKDEDATDAPVTLNTSRSNTSNAQSTSTRSK